jgi:dCTP deaminase
MYLSDRELEEAIRCGRLIVDPPTEIGPTSIDLHLDSVEQAKIWDVAAFRSDNPMAGHAELELNIGKFQYGKFSQRYLQSPPADPAAPVFRRDRQIVVRPNGFLLWQTLEKVGTPEKDPQLILFIDGKSTRTARTGLVVHLTAPTIHAGWSGKVTLELANLGPFNIVLTEGDAVAQIVVATISSVPKVSMAKVSTTHGQMHVSGMKG